MKGGGHSLKAKAEGVASPAPDQALQPRPARRIGG